MKLENRIDKALWKLRGGVNSRGKCPVCGTIFFRTKFTRRFCSEKCENVQKTRRYREKKV